MILFTLKKSATKHEYKTNVRKAVAAIRSKMLDLLRGFDISKLINGLVKFICTFKSVIRPDRALPRVFSSCKHPVQYRKNFLGAGHP